MSTYRKKPVVVEATQWLKAGDHPAVKARIPEILFDRAGNYFYVTSADDKCWPNFWLAVDPNGEVAQKNGVQLPFAFFEVKSGARVPISERPDLLDAYAKAAGWKERPRVFGLIETLEGRHIVTPGDWIITGVKGEHYPCKPDIFAATYDPVVSDDFDLPAKACDLSGEGTCEACQ